MTRTVGDDRATSVAAPGRRGISKSDAIRRMTLVTAGETDAGELWPCSCTTGKCAVVTHAVPSWDTRTAVREAAAVLAAAVAAPDGPAARAALARPAPSTGGTASRPCSPSTT